ncbi:hypothetical protein [Bacillus sp. FJAT-50079]|uniref:hypothetical protein n=1 Tax=Bacillus sp. FJAT-50079 TaxID=2833577 RepID=UPI001BCA39B8|nr:hypothetical protein [Bacillus sp. FJAT-50079]MBS4209489.1 hypothetical protein [Bacillus sp. FJAT-50079]
MKLKMVILIISIVGTLILVGCQLRPTETMVLLDEKISKVEISKSNGFGEMNEDIMQTYTDAESIKIFRHVITAAQKQKDKIDISEPEYDVMIGYTSEEGPLPTHAIHLWLGKENEKSMFMYLGDKDVYFTTVKDTQKLRSFIQSNL